MDYDLTSLPANYDRGRDLSPVVLDLWMHALAAHVQGRSIIRILDLGCGTGRFSPALAAHFNAKVTGIDPSIKMLERALEKKHDRVEYVQGSAEAIPLPSKSVDMIFISMSFHHFTDRRAATAECRRVLREGGWVFVRTGTREQMQAYPFVPFFPSTPAILNEVLPSHRELRAAFENAGFHLATSEKIEQTIAPSWSVYADRLSAGGDSVIARLSADELEGGLAAMRLHGVKAGQTPIVEAIDFFVFR
jgi:ubiquinone/menaquinone biosynthesis C-methylase UbiE